MPNTEYIDRVNYNEWKFIWAHDSSIRLRTASGEVTAFFLAESLMVQSYGRRDKCCACLCPFLWTAQDQIIGSTLMTLSSANHLLHTPEQICEIHTLLIPHKAIKFQYVHP